MTIDDFIYTDLQNVKGKTIFNFNCKICNTKFTINAAMIRSMIKGTTDKQYCCSRKCASVYRRKHKEKHCIQCNTIFKSKYIKNKFCSNSCAASYNNAHKKYGNRRSKLEKYIEEQLTSLYPSLEIHYNRKDAINSELDIFIPSLKLAIELNGIFHYEPIFNSDQLSKIKNNDNRKMQACIERGIELCVIDTSSQKYFKPHTSLKFLTIINNLITIKLTSD